MLTGVILLGAANPAVSQTLLEENFTFAGLLTANGWTATSGAGSNSITAAAPGLTYANLPSSGTGNAASLTTSGEDVRKTYAATTTDIYTSCLVNFSAAQSAGDYFYSLSSGASGFVGRLFAKSNGTGFQLGIQKGTTTPPSYVLTDLAFGTTYLVVIKIKKNSGTTSDDVASLWINPVLGASETTPNATMSAGTDQASIDSVVLRQGAAAGAPTVRVGNILVGTTWASVTPSTSATAPIIDSFSPVSGEIGSTIIITGIRFGAAPAVRFNGIAASSTVNPAGTEITATVPSGATTGPISVEVAGQPIATSSGNFTVVDPLAPTLSTSGTLTAFSTVVGTPSASQSLTVSGANLSGNATITAPAGFEVSSNDSIFGPTATLVPVGGVLTALPVYVRIAGAASVGPIAGNVSVAASGATTQNVSASGTVSPIPTFITLTNTNASSYSQNFDSLGTTTISNVVSLTTGVQTSLGGLVTNSLNGWYAAKIAGSAGISNIVADSGTGISGAVYNYGGTIAPASADRSLGALATASFTPGFGALIKNETGQALQGVQISFTAKFWRSSTASNSLTFGYGLVDGSTFTTTNFLTAVGASALAAADVVYPPAATNAALDGNLPANQVAFNNVTIPQTLAPGETLFVRWQDFDGPGSDAGMAIDNVSLTALSQPPPATAPFVSPTTAPPNEINRTQATLTSAVTGDGGSVITARGFVYSVQSLNPTPALGGTNVIDAPNGTAEVGAMSQTLTGLTAGTTYAVRSYASNAVGTTYSAVITFTTLSPPLSFTGSYNESFSSYTGTLPAGWTATSSSNSLTYGGDWGSGSTGGFRGVGATTGNVLGYQHTSSTGLLTVGVTFTNGTGTTLNALNVSYLGRTAAAANTRTPEWIVSLNGTAIASLAYSTGNTDGAGGVPADLTRSTQLTGLGIAPGAEFTITWSSERGVGSGNSRQIGLADFSVSSVDPTAPSIVPNPSSITNFTAIQGSESANQQVTVTGVNLGGSNITVTSTNNFYLISTNAFATAGSNVLTLAPTGGVLAVRISTNAPVTSNLVGGLTLVGGGASNTVSLRGMVTSSNAPSITVSPTNLAPFNSTTNLASTAQSFFARGTNLSTNVTVTAPTGFSVAFTTNNADFTNTLTLTNSGGIATNREIFVRMNASAVTNTLSARNVTVASTGATTQNVTVSGTIGAAPVGPTINVSPTNLSGFVAAQGTNSTNQTVSVSGTNLTGNLIISAPPGYEVSTNALSGFGSSLVLTSTGGTSVVTNLATDSATNAAYSAGWNNGANGGTGFGAWAIAASNNPPNWYAGAFIANPTNAGISTNGLGSSAFGLYANPPGTVASVAATRSFSNALGVGETFSFEWAVNFDTDSTNSKGFRILSGVSELLTVGQSGFPGSIFLVSGDLTNSNLPITYGTNAMKWSVERTSSTNLLVSSTGRDGSNITVFSTNIAIASAPDAFVWFAGAMGTSSPDQRQPYFNNLNIRSTTTTGGSVAPTPVYVRIAGNTGATNSLGGNITLTSSGASAASVSLSGRVAQVTTSTSSLAPFVSLNGAASSPQTFMASGVGLGTTPITIEAPTGFEISSDGGTSYSPMLTLTPVGGSVAGATITVRMPAGQTVGATPSGNIALTSAPASQAVTVSGTVEPPGPFIQPSVSSLTNFFTVVGNASVSVTNVYRAFSLSNVPITNAVTQGYEISTNNVDFAGAVINTPTSSNALFTNYVRIATNAPITNSLSGTLTIAAAGATNRSITLSGTVAPVPSGNANPGSLTNIWTVAGFASAAQPVSLTVSNLVATNRTVGASLGEGPFQVSTNGSGGFASSLVITSATSSLTNFPLYVRLSNSSSGTFATNLAVAVPANGTLTNFAVPVSGSALPRPVIAANPTNLSSIRAISPGSSAPTNFLLSASNLLQGVRVALTNSSAFEISTNSAGGFTNVLLVEPPLAAQDRAADYANGWTNGANGGSGFGPWVITNAAGVSLTNPSASGVSGMTSPAFALVGTNATEATRPFSSPLTIGQRFSVVWGNNVASNSLASKGVRLLAGTNRLVDVGMSTNSTVVTVNGQTMFTNSGTSPVTLNFQYVATNTLFVHATGPNGSEVYSGTFAYTNTTNAPDGVSFYTAGLPTNNLTNRFAFFDNMVISQATNNGGGAISNVSVFVRLKAGLPLVSQTNGVILLTSGAYAQPQQVQISGQVVTNSLSVSTNALSFSTIIGNPSGAQTFTISATNLTSDITLTPPSGFAVSTNGTTFSTTPLTIPLSQFQSPATVSVRLNGSALGSTSGNLTVTSGGLSANVALTGVVSAVPQLSVAGSLTPFISVQGISSGVQSFVLNGVGLQGSVSISSPSRLEFSATSGGPFVPNLIISPQGGSVNNATIFVRVSAGAAQGGPEAVAITAFAANTAVAAASLSTTVTVLASNNPYGIDQPLGQGKFYSPVLGVLFIDPAKPSLAWSESLRSYLTTDGSLLWSYDYGFLTVSPSSPWAYSPQLGYLQVNGHGRAAPWVYSILYGWIASNSDGSASWFWSERLQSWLFSAYRVGLWSMDFGWIAPLNVSGRLYTTSLGTVQTGDFGGRVWKWSFDWISAYRDGTASTFWSSSRGWFTSGGNGTVRILAPPSTVPVD